MILTSEVIDFVVETCRKAEPTINVESYIFLERIRDRQNFATVMLDSRADTCLVGSKGLGYIECDVSVIVCHQSKDAAVSAVESYAQALTVQYVRYKNTNIVCAHPKNLEMSGKTETGGHTYTLTTKIIASN